MTACDEVRTALGALAVGALEPAEERRVREHLDSCPDCGREAVALTGTVGALALVDPPAQPSPELLPGLLARVAAARRQRRLIGLATAAVAAILAGAVGLALGVRSQEPVAAADEPVVSVSGSEQSIGLQVDAWDKGWGTAVRASVSGVPAGNRCSLVAVGTDGAREIAATWVVPGDGYQSGGALTVDGAVGLYSDEVDYYEVVTLDGKTLVTAPATAPQ